MPARPSRSLPIAVVLSRGLAIAVVLRRGLAFGVVLRRGLAFAGVLSRGLAIGVLVSGVWALCGRVDGVEAREVWRRPVPGDVVARFTFDATDPYRAGARRGVAFFTARGSAVRAACRGRVTFAGPLPAPAASGVTLRCGAVAATHLGLSTLAVRLGTTVRAGAVLGAAAGDTIRLGARRVGRRHGYLDPLTLLVTTPARHRPFAAPVPPASRRPPSIPTGPATAPLAAPRTAPLTAPRGTPRTTPLAAWLGLALLALGVPAGGGVALARRRRRTSAQPLGHARPARASRAPR